MLGGEEVIGLGGAAGGAPAPRVCWRAQRVGSVLVHQLAPAVASEVVGQLVRLVLQDRVRPVHVHPRGAPTAANSYYNSYLSFGVYSNVSDGAYCNPYDDNYYAKFCAP
nr:unnamed protein product [Digitaria exilis]